MTTQNNGNNLVVQGRILWSMGSDMFAGQQKKDFNTGVPMTGVDGNPVVEYGFGLAIPKLDPTTNQATAEYTNVWNALHTEARTLYPDGNIPPNFAMKYKDGDGIDHNGKPFADREGYAGHIILICSTRIPIKYFRFENGNNVLVNDGIKCGDYVNVQINIKAHVAKGAGNAGLYMNPSAVQLIQSGKAIVNAPSGDQLFGAAAPAAYAGAVVAPVEPTMPGQAPVAQTMPGQAPTAQTAAIAPQPAPAPTPAPHYGVLPATHQPTAAPTMTAPPMPGM